VAGLTTEQMPSYRLLPGVFPARLLPSKRHTRFRPETLQRRHGN